MHYKMHCARNHAQSVIACLSLGGNPECKFLNKYAFPIVKKDILDCKKGIFFYNKNTQFGSMVGSAVAQW